MLFVIVCSLMSSCSDRPKTYTIGVINSLSPLDSVLEGFKEGMAELGYFEGENITYLYPGATINMEILDSMARDLAADDVDLILSITTPATKAAHRATADTDVPVVFVPVTDPVGAGLVESLRRPGGNITGISFGIQERKRLEFLMKAAPSIKRIYFPYNPEDQSPVLALEIIRKAAAEFGVSLIEYAVRTSEEIVTASQHIPEDADAFFLPPDSLVVSKQAYFIRAANKLKLPVTGPNIEAVTDHGALIAFGMESMASGKQAAHLAHQILRGAKPVDLPVETAEFRLAVNLRAAEAIGLDIPDEILLQAHTIIR
jgi:putative ABC transport system substrate-binding protein